MKCPNCGYQSGAHRIKQKRITDLTDTQVAELLGVTRVHLNMVLNGVRRSRRLLERYHQLQSGAADSRNPKS